MTGEGPPIRVVGLVLAAGAATRFGSDKLAAPLDGRSVLDHVLEALRLVPLDDIVVVTRPGRRDADGTLQVRWVPNPAPDQGLSSSLRVGLGAILDLPGPRVDAVLIALGDQPRVDPAVIRRLIHVGTSSTQDVVVPRYRERGEPGGPGRHPLLLRREAFGLANAATGDRGLGPVLRARRELVREVPVSGTNPDVDTPADLEQLRTEAPGPTE